MRQVMETNPELRNALEDPEFMRRSMEMMRDPSAMQNMMRKSRLLVLINNIIALLVRTCTLLKAPISYLWHFFEP